ncbi:MAG TPA: alpha/beta hydrolase [Stellaceae bacterium]|nr:alpha/beta hydrolase [Stellaceae bacterium]
MPAIRLAEGLSLHCAVDDFLWPWQRPVPVVMLHGFARNAQFWNRWVPAIAETRRVYRPELLGCGDSDPLPAETRVSPEMIARQILAVLDAFALEGVHWVGESSGGIVGLLIAAQYPERIKSLVLCNTPSRISDEIRRIYALGHADVGAAIRALGTGEWCRRTLSYRLDTAHAGAPLCDWVVAEMDKTQPAAAAALHECFESVDTMPLLARVRAPTLLLCGDGSPIASAMQRKLAETLPHGRLQLFAGYGHGINLLQPERCARAALDFWDSLDRPEL